MGLTASSAADLEINVRADTDHAERGMRRMGGMVSGAAGGMVRNLAMIGGPLAAGAAVAGIGRMVMAGSDLQENANKIAVVFGPASDRVNAYIQSMADNFGLVKAEMGEAVSNIGLIAKGAGLAEGPAANMGMTMASLAADASSFYNVPVADALAAIRSGLVGESEPLRQYGVMLSEAAVENEAVRLGLIRRGEAMTDTDKVMARSSLIQQGFADAQGDLARTQDGLANRVRELQGRFKNFVADLGARAIPMILNLWDTLEGFAGVVGPYLTQGFEAARPVLATIGRVIGEVVGHVRDFIAEDPRPFLAGLAAVAGVLAIALGAAAMSAIAVYLPFAAGAAAIGLLAAGIVYAYTHFEGFRNVVDSVVAWLTGTAWPMVQEFAAGIVDAFNVAVEWVRSVWPDVAVIVGAYLNIVRGYVTTVVGAVLAVWRTFGDNILAQVRNVWEFVGEYVRAGMDIVRNVIALVSSIIQGKWGRAWHALLGILRGVWNGIFAIVRLAVRTVGNIIRGLAPLLARLMAAAWRAGWNAAQGIVAAIIVWVRGIPGRWAAALSALAGLLAAKGRAGLHGLWNGAKAVADAVRGWIAGLPGRLVAAVGDLGNLLKNAGRDLLRGLMDGIQEMMGPLGDALGGVTGFIADHKGPPERDRVLLRPAGRLIMAGLAEGLTGGMGPVRTALAGITLELERGITAQVAPTFTAGGTLGTSSSSSSGPPGPSPPSSSEVAPRAPWWPLEGSPPARWNARPHGPPRPAAAVAQEARDDVGRLPSHRGAHPRGARAPPRRRHPLPRARVQPLRAQPLEGGEPAPPPPTWRVAG